MNLRIPGPTPCPDPVLQAMRRQMINHRGEEFRDLLFKITGQLKKFFKTENDLFILTGSGTGGMEAAVVNFLSPGDHVLVLSNGVFGERFAAIAEAFGANVERLSFPWGTAIRPEAVREALRRNSKIKAVFVVHNETSTGLTNDLRSIARVVREFEKLLIVDAVSSLGCIELETDEWGCDVVVTASQKGWMSPPGLAFISVSELAWRYHAEAKMPRFYWDLSKAKRFFEQGQTPWTPAMSTLFALSAALDLMEAEGLENIFERHRRIGEKVRAGIKALGLSLFPEEEYASNTVTAVRAPEGLDVAKLLKILREEHGVVLAGGQERLRGKIFRIGHLGMVREEDIEEVLEKLRLALPRAGFVPVG